MSKKNQSSTTNNLLKIGAIACTVTGLLLLSLLILPVSLASPDEFPLPAPSPRPPLTDGNGGDGGGNSGSAIFGTVTDLSRDAAGAAIEVSVNGAIVRTDTDGTYSITGLNAGDYIVLLELHGQGQPAQGPVHVILDGSHNATINLEYYSQPSPTDTPQPTATTPTEPAKATPADLPDSGAPTSHRPPIIIGLGLVLLIAGIVLFNKSRGSANQQNPAQKSNN
ncbi:MAG: carboxypeptidase regulatory-like domain-containing protein [Chloroflexi bacterium]|nr:MAG: carboxypeptidase regulatory-like domain-containing protein [Chloroflexota bacterium]